jgi:hypothetical protein
MAKAEANISMALAGFVTSPDLNRYPRPGRGRRDPAYLARRELSLGQPT